MAIIAPRRRLASRSEPKQCKEQRHVRGGLDPHSGRIEQPGSDRGHLQSFGSRTSPFGYGKQLEAIAFTERANLIQTATCLTRDFLVCPGPQKGALGFGYRADHANVGYDFDSV